MLDDGDRRQRRVMLESHPDMLELRRLILRLSLISHAPVQGYDFAPSDVGRGERWRRSDRYAPIPHLGQHLPKSGDTQIPRGDVDRKGDLTPEFRQKSDVYFRKRIGRLRTESDLADLLQQARDALRDWQKTPEVAGVEPERGSFLWKCRIADDDRPAKVVQGTFWVSAATVYRYRLKYRGLRKQAA